MVVEHGPVIQGTGRLEIHHVVGRKGKHNKVLIGPWFILPLPWQYHDPGSNDPLNVTYFRHRFTQAFGLQTALFAQMVETIENRGNPVPDGNILQAIQDTNL